MRLLERAKAVLEQKYQRPPTEEEITAELGISAAQYHAWRSASQGLTPESLDLIAEEHESGSQGRFLANSDEHWPSYLAERAEQERLLRQAIKTLPDRERTVLNLYYYEELTLTEIAKIMGLHESRISQMKSQAVRRLRRCLLSQK
jgi:RNA polymerase sigma factor FliA